MFLLWFKRFKRRQVCHEQWPPALEQQLHTEEITMGHNEQKVRRETDWDSHRRTTDQKKKGTRARSRGGHVRQEVNDSGEG